MTKKTFFIPEGADELENHPYVPVLIDTNIVLETTNWFEKMCCKSTIEENKEVPAIFNFIDTEIENAAAEKSDSVFQRYLRVRRSEDEYFYWYFKTRFDSLNDCKNALERCPSAKNKIIQTYRQAGELEKDSRHKDFALIIEGLELSSIEGLQPKIVTHDKALQDAWNKLSHLSCDTLRPRYYNLRENSGDDSEGKVSFLKKPDGRTLEKSHMRGEKYA